MTQSKVLTAFIDNVEIGNVSTAQDYLKRLRVFQDFVFRNYNLSLDQLIDTLTTSNELNVYDIISKFIAYIQQERKVSPITVKAYVSTIRTFLETNDVEISPRKFKFKVKKPRVIRKEKEPLHKSDIQVILNACHSIRLKTYVLFLAATATRAEEALSVRISDIDFEKNPATVFIRGEFTKMKTDRTIMLTRELQQHLQQWIQYKYRTRTITRYNNNHARNLPKTVAEKITPAVKENQLLFAIGNIKNEDSFHGLYNNFIGMFEDVLDRLGGKYAQFESSGKRRKITLHSMRRFCKTTISDLGYGDFSEWYLGHKGSSYYNASDPAKIDLFRKIEPSLTFLDQLALERKGADLESRLEFMEQKNYELKEQQKIKDDKINSALEAIEKIKKATGLSF
jgi:integrase